MAPQSPAGRLAARANDVLKQLIQANDDWDKAYRRLKNDSARVEQELRAELEQTRRRQHEREAGVDCSSREPRRPATTTTRDTETIAGGAAASPPPSPPLGSAPPPALLPQLNAPTGADDSLAALSSSILSALGFSSLSSLETFLLSHPLPSGGLPALHAQLAADRAVVSALSAGLADAHEAWESQERLELELEEEREKRWEEERRAAGWSRRCDALLERKGVQKEEAASGGCGKGVMDDDERGYGQQNRSPSARPASPTVQMAKKARLSPSSVVQPLTPSRKANLSRRPATAPTTTHHLQSQRPVPSPSPSSSTTTPRTSGRSAAAAVAAASDQNHPLPPPAPPTPPAALLLSQNAALRQALRDRQAKHRSDRRGWRTFTGKVVELYRQGKEEAADEPDGVAVGGRLGEAESISRGGRGGPLVAEGPLVAPAWESTNPFVSSGRPVIAPSSTADHARGPLRPSSRPGPSRLADRPHPPPSTAPAVVATGDRSGMLVDARANPFIAPSGLTPQPAVPRSRSAARQAATPTMTTTVAEPMAVDEDEVPAISPATAMEVATSRSYKRATTTRGEETTSDSWPAVGQTARQVGTVGGATGRTSRPTSPSPLTDHQRMYRCRLSSPAGLPPPRPPVLESSIRPSGGRILPPSESVSSLTPLSSSPPAAGASIAERRSPQLAIDQPEPSVGTASDNEDENDVVGTSVPQERASHRLSSTHTSSTGTRPGVPSHLSDVDRKLLEVAERETKRWERQQRSTPFTTATAEPRDAEANDVFGVAPSNGSGDRLEQRRPDLDSPSAFMAAVAGEVTPSTVATSNRTATGRDQTEASSNALPTPTTVARPTKTAAAAAAAADEKSTHPSTAPTGATQVNASASTSRLSRPNGSAISDSRREPPVDRLAAAAGPTPRPTTERPAKRRWLGRHLFDERVREGLPTPLSIAQGNGARGKRKMAAREDNDDDDFDVDIDTPVRDGGIRPLALGFASSSNATPTEPVSASRQQGKRLATDLSASASTTAPLHPPLVKLEPVDQPNPKALRINVPNAQVAVLVPDSPPSGESTRAQRRPAWERTPSEELAEAAHYRAIEGPTKGMTPAERKAFNRSLRDKPANEVAALFKQFKGRGRYGDEQQLNVDRTINQDFEIVRERNQGRDYAYDSVVRNRDDRRLMHGTDCECCRGYYEAVGPLAPLPAGPVWRRAAAAAPTTMEADDESTADRCARERQAGIESHRQAVSRHREDFAVPQTPPQYFETGMYDDDQIDAINAEAARRAVQKRKRIEAEAARGNGKYRRRL